MKQAGRYEGLFALSPDGILLIDAATLRALEFNDAACRQLGYTREEFARLAIPDYEASQSREEIAEHVRRALREGVIDFATSHRTKTGEVRHVHVWGKALDLDGRAAFHAIFRDITDRQRAEQALRDSEARFRALFDRAHDAIFVMNADAFVDCNRHAEMLFGCRRADLIGQSPVVFSPVTQPGGLASAEAAAGYVSAALAGEPQRFEWRHLRADGTAFDAEVSLSRIDTSGDTLIQAIVRDVTERARAQQALKDSERLLRESQAIAGLGSYVLEIATGMWRGSGNLDVIFGLSSGTERSVPSWLSIIHPDWRDRMSRYFDEHVLGQRRRFDMEYQIIRQSDGAARWVHGLGELECDAQDQPIRMIGTVTDITDRKRADTALRLQAAALYAAADAIVITDAAGVIEWVNPAFTRLTGYTAEEAVGKNPRDLVKSGKHPAAFYDNLWKTIIAGRTWHGEMLNRRKDGSLYSENQTVTPILDAAGGITHFVAIKQDITERLTLEARFRQAQRMETVGQLASGIAHDFNNLLTVINGMSELALEQLGPDTAAHRDVKEIRRAGERATALTRQLLAFSRQQILAPRVLNLGVVVAGMESLLRRLLGEDINLVATASPDLGNVMADPGQIEQVITNLAVNARDAMPQGGRLTIETHKVEVGADFGRQHGATVQPGPYVVLAVSDTGIGIDEATRARIFEPFFTTKVQGRGTGLGLSTVFGIVKQSQGFIWVYSELGHGTTFKIYLPLLTEALGADRLVPEPVSSCGTETILLVDDDEALREMARRFLVPAGYTVLCAASGDEAMRLLESHEGAVHLLVSDVVMPGISGRRLAELAAPARPQMKVLYMSGYTSDTIVRHGVLEGQVSYLEKPFSATALCQKIRTVLDAETALDT